MATAISFTQSSDAKTLIFSDDTVITDPISNYVRTVQIYDNINASGTLLDTLTFDGGDLTVEYEIDADQYFSARIVYTGSPTVATGSPINFVSTMYEYNLLDKKLLINCGCGKCKGCDNVKYGFMYLSLSQKAVINSNPAKANSYIQASLKWLKS